MAEPVTLALVRAHCRLDADDTSEDALLTVYIVAARQWVEGCTGLDLIAEDVVAPGALVLAILTLVAHWYETRELGSIPSTAEDLCFSSRTVLL